MYGRACMELHNMILLLGFSDLLFGTVDSMSVFHEVQSSISGCTLEIYLDVMSRSAFPKRREDN